MTGGVFFGALAASLLGGLLCVDRTAALQVMVSRPIVAGPLAGMLMGSNEAGLAAGGLIELLYIGDLPVGRYVPVNDTALTVVVATVSASVLAAPGAPTGSWAAFSVVPIALIVSLAFSRIFSLADDLARRRNKRLYDSAFVALSSGLGSRVITENLKGSLFFFISNAVAIFLTVLPLMLLARYAGVIAGSYAVFYLSFALCGVIASASALRALRSGRSIEVFAVAAAVTAALLVL